MFKGATTKKSYQQSNHVSTITIVNSQLVVAGLPHTQRTQGIQGNSGNFQVEENLRETQGILI